MFSSRKNPQLCQRRNDLSLQQTTIFKRGGREDIKVACSWLFHVLLSQYFSLGLLKYAVGLDR